MQAHDFHRSKAKPALSFTRSTKRACSEEAGSWCNTIPYLNASSCSIPQPFDSKALCNMNLEINPSPQQLQRINDHIVLLKESANRKNSDANLTLVLNPHQHRVITEMRRTLGSERRAAVCVT